MHASKTHLAFVMGYFNGQAGHENWWWTKSGEIWIWTIEPKRSAISRLHEGGTIAMTSSFKKRLSRKWTCLHPEAVKNAKHISSWWPRSKYIMTSLWSRGSTQQWSPYGRKLIKYKFYAWIGLSGVIYSLPKSGSKEGRWLLTQVKKITKN